MKDDVTGRDLFDRGHHDSKALADIEASNCRALWLAVLQQAVNDVSGPPVGVGPNEYDVRAQQAEDFLAGKDRGLRIVCELAGVNPERVSQRYLEGKLDGSGGKQGRRNKTGPKPAIQEGLW